MVLCYYAVYTVYLCVVELVMPCLCCCLCVRLGKLQACVHTSRLLMIPHSGLCLCYMPLQQQRLSCVKCCTLVSLPSPVHWVVFEVLLLCVVRGYTRSANRTCSMSSVTHLGNQRTW